MTLNSMQTLIKRLRRSSVVRQRFVESHLKKGIAFQIRAIRDTLELSQEQLAELVGMNQNAISRLESTEYGKPTITTLKRLAAAFDVALVVRFVPFSEMVHWVSGTPYRNKGLSSESLAVPTFKVEEEKHVFDAMSVASEIQAELNNNPVASATKAAAAQTIAGFSFLDPSALEKIRRSMSNQASLIAGERSFVPETSKSQGGVEEGSIGWVLQSIPAGADASHKNIHLVYPKPQPSSENVTDCNLSNSGVTQAAMVVNF